MVLNLISRVFGTKHERDIKRMWPLVEEINEQYGRLRELPDEALRQKTADFRARHPDGRMGSNPGLATPEAGEALVRAAVAGLIREIAAFSGEG